MLASTAFMLLSGAFRVVQGIIDSAPKVAEIDMLSRGNASVLYDDSGKKIQDIDDTDRAQEYVSIDGVPKGVQKAFLAVQDSRYYEHHGIDVQGILQELYQGVFGQESSDMQSGTITQQLIQNQVLHLDAEQTVPERIRHKITELYLAVSLENNMGKEQILEYYLNTVSFGQNVLGVQSAARKYFNKDIREVTVSEAAVLAAMLSDPTEYNPVSSKEKNAKQRKVILKKMLEEGYLKEDEYADALGDDVYLRVQGITNTQANVKEKINSYYVDSVIEQVIADLKKSLGYSQTKAYNMVYRGGLRIYTCQNTQLQQSCDTVINQSDAYPWAGKSYLSYYLVIKKDGQEKKYNELDMKNFYLNTLHKKISLNIEKTKKAKQYTKKFKREMLKQGGKVVSENFQLIKQPQASVVLMEQSTGEVKALLGGRGQRIANSTVNRATQVKNQPGTLFDIPAVYAPALDTSGLTLGHTEDDTTYKNSSTGKVIQDVVTGKKEGYLTIRDAIKQSKAVMAVKVLEKVSLQTADDFLAKFGFSTIIEQRETLENEEGKVSTDLQLSLAQGQLIDGVTNLELTTAYAAIANAGLYNSPKFYTKVVDEEGNILLEQKSASKRILKEETAWLLTDALEDTIDEKEYKRAQLSYEKLEYAGKAGYTKDQTDSWFLGYSPYYTVGIWSGNDENTSLEQSDYTMVLWKEIMEQIHKNEKQKKGTFQKPDNITAVDICTKCGRLAVKGLCDKAEGGSCVRKEYYREGTQPTQNCNCHVKYFFCTKCGRLAGRSTAKEDGDYKVFLKKKEEYETEDTKNTIEKNTADGICEGH